MYAELIAVQLERRLTMFYFTKINVFPIWNDASYVYTKCLLLIEQKNCNMLHFIGKNLLL